MPAKQFVPLTLALVSEGDFLVEADTELATAQQGLLAFVRQHGERAAGAKAKVTLEITLVCDNPKAEAFSIKAQAKRTLPARPAVVSSAIGADDEGVPALFVRRSGSDEGDPLQGKLATRNGVTVNTETGEVIAEHGQ